MDSLAHVGACRGTPLPRDRVHSPGWSMPQRYTVIIEKHGDRYVIFCSAQPEIRAEGETPKAAVELMKEKIRQAIQEGVLQRSDWEDYLSDDHADFEDAVIEGLGNLRDLEGKTVSEIPEQIPRDRYGFYSSCTPIPAGWPPEAMIRRSAAGEKDGALVWSMNLVGKEWRPFYQMSLEYYGKDGHEAAYIYERATSGDSVAYWPVVSLMFFAGRGCTQAGTRRCRWHVVNDGGREYDGSKIKFRYSDEFKMVMKRGCGLALLAGEREITLEVLEKAIGSVHATGQLPWRVYRVGSDVVKVLQTANQLANNAGTNQIGMECVVAAIRQFRGSSPPSDRGADA